ncbi:MAG: ABC transporter permease [bacterium]|nr:ABC transporter permease [bacterium]
MLRKIGWVARREFAATVMTRGFVIGVLVLPAIIALMAFVMPRMMDERAPRVVGTLAVVDDGNAVLPGLERELAPRELARRRVETGDRLRERISESLPEAAAAAAGATEAALAGALAAALGEVPDLRLQRIGEPELEAWKARLAAGTGGRPDDFGTAVAIIAVHPNAVVAADGAYGAYDFYVPPKLDDRLQDELRGALNRVLVEARVAAAGLDPGQVAALTSVTGYSTRVVTPDGERPSHEALNLLIPAAFMGLLLMSVMSTGQQLMTSTIEDKSSRVVEVLLAAASPVELMTGKILAQMGVGLLMLGIYAAMGIATLASFAVLDLVDPALVAWLVLFYILSYTMMAGLMGAIGAAVSDVSEAGALLGPVMMINMLPWLLWLPVSRHPDGALAVAMSFLPPVNLYAMLLRMSSASPPPLWQVLASTALAAGGAVGALWFASKVFRIALLLNGKPPSLRTLVRWARMA